MTTSALGSRLSALGARRTSIIGVVGFAAALALAAQVALPIPGSPVPITLQPMIVVLAGLWLGPVAAATSMALYLVAGAAGLPVFSPFGAPGVARLLGPTGGYLLAYPLAAWVAGRLGAGASSYARRALSASAGMCVLYAGGLAQLTLITGSLAQAAVVGAIPFAVLDLVKAHLAALLVAPPRRGRSTS